MNPSLQITPRSSPAPRISSAISTKSPIKSIREEQQYLLLKQVIGTTVSSNTSVACVSSSRIVAYIAGAVAVVTTIDEEGRSTQHTFRATPSTIGSNLQSQPESPAPARVLQPQRGKLSTNFRESSPGLSIAGPFSDVSESPSSRGAALRCRVKPITCISLSPDCKWIAVGETGYRPRVLIYALPGNSTANTPVCSVAEHTFGVKGLAFSHDSQFLASLGDINDGFIYVWSINQRNGSASLYATNKCTNNVKAFAWVGDNLVTVGTRHVKVWRLRRNTHDSPSKKFSDASITCTSPSKALHGRNCVLGFLLNKTYIAIVVIDLQRAIVCSDEGDICLLIENPSGPRFTKVADSNSTIFSACLVAQKWLMVGSVRGAVKRFDIEILTNTNLLPDHQPPGEAIFYSEPRLGEVLALAPIDKHIMVFGSARMAAMVETKTMEDCSTGLVSNRGPWCAHSSTLKGVKAVTLKEYPQASFFTFSSDGLISFWGIDGDHILDVNVSFGCTTDEVDLAGNELKTVTTVSEYDLICCGDQYGFLRVTNIATKLCVFETRAHSSEVISIDSCLVDGTAFVATAGRDRTIQIFRSDGNQFDLMQTLEDHIGFVTSLVFSNGGERLVSCSSDRSILVRDLVAGNIDGTDRRAYVVGRTINLKSTPLSITTFKEDHTQVLLLSTADKNVTFFNLKDGTVQRSFKTADDEDGDSVSLNCVTYLSQGHRRIRVAGLTNADKSVRLYADDGSLISRDYGHTESVAGIVEICSEQEHDEPRLVTVATDGTILIWKLSNRTEGQPSLLKSPDITQGTPGANAFFSPRPPIRRVLSSSELGKLQSSSTNAVNPPPYEAIRSRSRSPRRKMSKLSLEDTPEIEFPSLTAGTQRSNGTSTKDLEGLSIADRKSVRVRSPSPSSPRRHQQSKPTTRQLRRQSSQPTFSTVHGRKGPQSPEGLSPMHSSNTSNYANSLVASTQQVCRSLNRYRRNLAVSEEPLPVENVRELERELSQTARALAEKAARSEAVLEKLLDRYGERLVEIMERKIDEKVGRVLDRERNEPPRAEGEEASEVKSE